MPLGPFRHQGVGQRDEDAAANVTDKVDESRYLVVLLRGNSEIGSSGDGNKNEGDGDNLHHAQFRRETEADEKAEVLRGVEIPDGEDDKTHRNQVSRRESA